LKGAAAESSGTSFHSVLLRMFFRYQVWAWLTICTDGSSATSAK
jgi:hypothetical protein